MVLRPLLRALLLHPLLRGTLLGGIVVLLRPLLADWFPPFSLDGAAVFRRPAGGFVVDLPGDRRNGHRRRVAGGAGFNGVQPVDQFGDGVNPVLVPWGAVEEYCSGAENPGKSSAASSVRAARTALMQNPDSFALPEGVM